MINISQVKLHPRFSTCFASTGLWLTPPNPRVNGVYSCLTTDYFCLTTTLSGTIYRNSVSVSKKFISTIFTFLFWTTSYPLRVLIPRTIFARAQYATELVSRKATIKSLFTVFARFNHVTIVTHVNTSGIITGTPDYVTFSVFGTWARE